MPPATFMIAVGDPSVLQSREICVSAPAHGEVQIRQSVIGVNFVDLYYCTGFHRRRDAGTDAGCVRPFGIVAASVNPPPRYRLSASETSALRNRSR